MRLAGENGGLDRATRYLEQALELSPGNPAIRHSLAEVALRRSTVSNDGFEKASWMRSAEAQAQSLLRNTRTSHPHHTLAKSAIAAVKMAIEKAERDDNELAQESVAEAIKNAEDVLRAGLQSFPNDDRLLNEEATLGEILKNASRALNALQRASVSNPRSELIARRLSRILRAKGSMSEAIDVLRRTLELNQGSQVLHFELARAMMEISPDADITNGEAILYHLQRALAPGDRNNEARFWLARQHCLCGDPKIAASLFGHLKMLPVPFRQKMSVRGVVKASDGRPADYYGVIYSVKTAFGFLRGDKNGLETYFNADQIATELDPTIEGQRVRYDLGFTLRGPVALNLKLVD
jgi:tetratricopeptide (TPR) repeat protein